MANRQCNLTVAFQTAGWSFYHRLEIHILTGSDYPNQAFLDGKEGDRVNQKGKVQSQVPNVNRQNQDQNQANIWGLTSISAFLCVSRLFFFLWEDSPIVLGNTIRGLVKGSPESRNNTSAKCRGCRLRC